MTVQYLTNAAGVQLAISGATTHGVLGTKAAETLTGTLANDSFRGYGGGDTLIGGKGDDSYNVYDVHDVAVENAGEGVDTVLATVSYTLGANVENLTLSNDSTYGEGNSQDNILTGLAGVQTLNGGAGNDILTGGAGADTFIMQAAGGRDAITDFQTGVDQARLADSGFTTFAQVRGAMTQQGADVALTYATGEQLLFRAHQVSDFTPGDFQLPLNTNGLTATFTDDFNSLSLYNGSSTNYHPGSGTWWTRYGSGANLTSFTLPQNGEMQIYANPTLTGTGTTPLGINPFSVSNGVASIIAAPTSASDAAALWGYGYTSGLMTTKLSFAQQYGYFEVRAKLPTGNGLWPAFWLLPVHPAGSAEIDIFEQLGRDPSTIFETSHTQASGTSTYVTKVAHVDTPDQFHTYGMLWDKNYLVWYIDGVEVNRQVTSPDQNTPMYMLLNLAVGGSWPGAPDATTPFPASMGLDYVHVFALNSSAPVAVGDAYSTLQNTALSVTVNSGLLANDTTPTSNSLTASLVSGAAHGAVVVSADGSFTYTPDAGYAGTDSFSYKATSGAAQSATATVNLTVGQVFTNHAPVMSGPSALAASNEDVARTITKAELLSAASDQDGDALSITGLAASSGSLVDNHDGTWTFQPGANDDTQVSFTYQVSDGTVATAATATLDLLPVNDPPVVSGAAVLTASNEDTARVVTSAELLALASDVEGDALSVTGLVASSGSLTDNHDGTWTFQPAANDDTQAAFTYQVSDGQAATAATATLDLVPVNDAPTAADGSVSGAEDQPISGQVQAGDIDSSGLAYAVATGPQHGSVVLNADGSFVYTPNADYSGPDSFTFKANDGQLDSNIATVSLTVAPVNDAPTTSAASATFNDTAAKVFSASDFPFADGHDSPANGLAAVVITTLPGAGTLSYNGAPVVAGQSVSLADLAAGKLTFTPGIHGWGPGYASFSFQVRDDGGTANGGQDTSASAVMTLNVNHVNHAPAAGAEIATASTSGSVSLTIAQLLANDSDVDGDALFITGVTMGATPHGAVQLSGGIVTYTPTAGYAGSDSFTYDVSDGQATSHATVNVTIAAMSSVYTLGTAGNDIYDLSARTAPQLVSAQGGNDFVSGGAGADSLSGGAGADVLKGGGGADSLTGGAGSDVLTGGSGADSFLFTDPTDFGPAGQEDVITDFNRVEGDRIRLDQIDANSLLTGNQAFTWLGTGAFTHVGGQLEYAAVGQDAMVYGDLNGDGVADFQFRLLGVHTLQASDFYL